MRYRPPAAARLHTHRGIHGVPRDWKVKICGLVQEAGLVPAGGVALPRFGGALIDGLNVVEGWACAGCEYAVACKKVMARHVKTVHAGEKCGFKEASIQAFFRSFGGKYFVVRKGLSVERREVTGVSNLMVEYLNFLDKNGNQVLDGTSFERFWPMALRE